MDAVNAYAAAFAVGLFGGAHCLGMCGGIMAALSFAVPAEAKLKRLMILLSYNAGRIGSYTLLGFLVGLLGQQFNEELSRSLLPYLAGGLLIAMGLYLADWWRGLTYLERLGGSLWKYLQPLSKKLMPVKNPLSAVALGAIWGWLPCGLIYTALVYAMAQGSAPEAAGVMLAFGLGTLPTVLAGGWFAESLKRFIQAKGWRQFMAVCIIAFGVWTIWIAVQHAGHAGHGGDHSGHGVEHSGHSVDHSGHSVNTEEVQQSGHEHHLHGEADHKAGDSVDSTKDSAAEHMPVDHSSAEHHKHHH